MPLAIELAAARIRAPLPRRSSRSGSATAPTARTGSRTALDRQQTLRATLDWSYELLDDAERELFAALSVFAGDFDIAAAEAVGGGSLDVLGRLVDKSLVLADRQDQEVRYRLLETFRQYGFEHLADPAAPIAPIAGTTSPWPSRSRPSAELGEDDGWIRVLTAEHPNLRAAIASGLRADPEEALRLVTALRWFWLDGGHLVEGLRWYAQALDARPEHDALRARALTAAGSLEFRRGRHAGDFEFYPELVDSARERGDRKELSRTLLLGGVLGFMTMHYDQALQACGEIVARGRPAARRVRPLHRGADALVPRRARGERGGLRAGARASSPSCRATTRPSSRCC